MQGNKEEVGQAKELGKSLTEIDAAEKHHLDKDILIIIEGLVGNGVAMEFMGFIEWADKSPDIERMLRREIKAKVPGRSDQRFAMSSALLSSKADR